MWGLRVEGDGGRDSWVSGTRGWEFRLLSPWVLVLQV